MARVRRINVSQIEGNNANENEITDIRPLGEIGIYFSEYNGVEKPELLMFDGTRTHIKSKILAPGIFYGSGADSGEGSGADTIKLIPDASLHYNDGSFGNDQYLIVDPTGGEPGHIHLRAGGTIDSSTADLYLGGELTCVRVSDNLGSVTIRTTNQGDPDITMNWTFDNQGYLYFPGIGNNRIGESEPGLVVSSDHGVVLQSNNSGESKEWLFGTDGVLLLPGGANIFAFNYDVAVIGGTDGVGTYGNVYIQTSNPSTTSTWTFGTQGELTLPGGGEIKSLEVTNSELGTTTTSVTLQPPNGWDSNMRLDIYPTEGGEGNHLHLTAGDQTTTDLYLGNDSHYVKIGGSSGHIELKGRNGINSPNTGTSAGSGGDIYLWAGYAGDNGGNFDDGAAAGSVYILSGASSTGTGGAVQISSGYGPQGYGFVEITTDGNSSRWKFNKDNELEFPDGSVQSTAFTIKSVPLTSTSTGVAGNIAYNENYFYVCTATNSWQRIGWDPTPW